MQAGPIQADREQDPQGFGAGSPASAFVTLMVGEQLCGLPVLSVRDIIATPVMTAIPLAPPEVAGSLNLRGRIVTAIDLRRRLGVANQDRANLDRANLDQTSLGMSIVVEQHGELYSLMVDAVREVVEYDPSQLEPNPPTLAGPWRDCAIGILRLRSELLVLLNAGRLLALDHGAA